MTNKVHFFRSDDVGAPSLTNAMGSLISVFDGCLVNGYNNQDATKLSGNVTSVADVATITFAAAHGFRELQLLEMKFPDLQYTGQFAVVSVTSTTVSVRLDAVPTNASVTPASDSYVKVAGSKWTKEFSEVNKAAYRPVPNTLNRCYLSIDDTRAVSDGCANVRGFETLTAATVGLGMFPTIAQQAISTIPKSQDSTAKQWYLIADGDMMYFFVNPSTQLSYGFAGFAFGYARSKMAVEDTYGCAIVSNNVANANSFSGLIRPDSLTYTTNYGYYARSFAQLGTAVPFGLYGSSIGNNSLGNAPEPFPSPIDNSLNVSPIYTFQGGTRGVMQGLLQPLHTKPLGLNSFYKGLADYPNQTAFAIPLASSSTTPQGEVHVIVEGTW